MLKGRTTMMKYLTNIVILRITTLEKRRLAICTQDDHKLTLSLQFMKVSILLSFQIDLKLCHTMTWISGVTLPQPMTHTPGLSQFQRPKRKLRNASSRISGTSRASKIKVRPRPKPKRLRRRSRRRSRRSRRNMPAEE